jgi:hypothetical protein
MLASFNILLSDSMSMHAQHRLLNLACAEAQQQNHDVLLTSEAKIATTSPWSTIIVRIQNCSITFHVNWTRKLPTKNSHAAGTITWH